MTKITSEQALVELITKGKELEWLSDNNEWLPMNSVVNPISEPNKDWRVKTEQPWEQCFRDYMDNYTDDGSSIEEQAYYRGWHDAMEYKETKKKKTLTLTGSKGIDLYDLNDPYNWGVPIHLR